ncbi:MULTISPECIES: primosomal replication protein N [unclassified Undibacterium]|uniref:primosomal replication protein N n=1 Tax=unclassified Undibacterium TaxID=2630295 RepID=UPI002AC8961E|nr:MULTISPECIES: primosomal replication protein N [unclassified Undibacterium]MEB0138042.1 primosomal replication protein N [Undibacterium sp. CCC2.1]MEB0171220.1 primosomal replication protein N [Undibacterium sp. CCC1.1]MEB0175265.1 primosomal replication protein N [Undibacterium sp. CCC3.4]MEB0214673.1 primosomal replication protein N [Undibacterium sp. 5I2]WPX42440.1 primosomal replication protein N [Undibacterium sp. CCC3.4]
MNHLQVVARIIEKSPLRYTPAGIPIASATLMHSSRQVEANIERLVEFEMTAQAAGQISAQFASLPMEVEMVFTGFLARKNRNSKSLVFHINEIGTNLLD